MDYHRGLAAPLIASNVGAAWMETNVLGSPTSLLRGGGQHGQIICVPVCYILDCSVGAWAYETVSQARNTGDPPGLSGFVSHLAPQLHNVLFYRAYLELFSLG